MNRNSYQQYGNGYGNSYGYGQHNADPQNMADAWQSSVAQSITDMRNHRSEDGNDTTKLFGLFEMDTAVVKGINSLYTAFGYKIVHLLAPKTYDTVLRYGKDFSIKGHALNTTGLHRTAAATTLGVGLGALLLPDIGKFTQTLFDHHHHKVDTVKKLASVLNDVKGKHTVGSFMGVKEQENSVLYAARRRMHKQHSGEVSGIVLGAFSKNILNFGTLGVYAHGIATGKPRFDIITGKFPDKVKKLTEELTDHNPGIGRDELEQTIIQRLAQEGGESSNMLLMFGGGAGLSQIVDMIVESSAKRREKGMQPYSALDMILTLDDQMQNNPGGRDRFQLPGVNGRGQELPLDQYIVQIFQQHQREMVDFNPKHSEIRKALDEDLGRIGKAIATKLRDGELSPMLLIHLVGEGQVVKKMGRGLASPEEVKTQIERFANKSRAFDVNDPQEYLKERNFDLEKVKQGLQHLQGEEKLDFAGTLPDAVLKAAGMNEKEIKSVQEHRVHEGYNTLLTHTLAGMAAKTDEELQQTGLGKTQINKLREAAESVAEGGDEALKKLKNGPTNAEGIEHLLTDYMVPKVAKDESYLSKLLSEGREKAATKQTEAAAANDEDGQKPGKYASRFTNKSRPDMPENDLDEADEERNFTDRASDRSDAAQGRY